PKGMIVADGWAARLGATVSYTVPAVARESALNILTRSVPPRLARMVDRTEDVVVYRLAGPSALAAAAAAGLEVSSAPSPPSPPPPPPPPAGRRLLRPDRPEAARAAAGAPAG